jgi:hypothetical protein
VYAFVSGRVVPRWVYDEKAKDCADWRAVAENATAALEHSVRDVAAPALDRLAGEKRG